MHEELTYDNKLSSTSHPRIMTAQENTINEVELKHLLRNIDDYISGNDEESISKTFSSIFPDVLSSKIKDVG